MKHSIHHPLLFFIILLTSGCGLIDTGITGWTLRFELAVGKMEAIVNDAKPKDSNAIKELELQSIELYKLANEFDDNEHDFKKELKERLNPEVSKLLKKRLQDQFHRLAKGFENALKKQIVTGKIADNFDHIGDELNLRVKFRMPD